VMLRDAACASRALQLFVLGASRHIPATERVCGAGHDLRESLAVRIRLADALRAAVGCLSGPLYFLT
jgi:hypothetical protein